MKSLNNLLFIVAIIVLIGAGRYSMAQVIDNSEVALAASKAKTESLQALKSYSWKMHCEFSLKGETQVIVLNQLRFNFDGELESSTLSTESQVKKKKRLKGKKQQKQIDEAKRFLEQTISLSLTYLFMSKGEMVDFFDNIEITEGEGSTIVVQGRDVRVTHDQLTLHLDKESYLDRKVQFSSTVDDTPITGEVVYKQIEDGPNSMARMLIEAPEKNVKIVVECFDFIKQQ
jgi:uncharacterized protein (UPF0333 family)